VNKVFATFVMLAHVKGCEWTGDFGHLYTAAGLGVSLKHQLYPSQYAILIYHGDLSPNVFKNASKA